MGTLEIIILIVAVVIFFVLRYVYKLGKQVEKREEIAKQQKTEREQILKTSTICPHCKSPNAKKLQECEWCGNKIC